MPPVVEGAKLNPPPLVVPVVVDAGLVPKEKPPPVDGGAADAVKAGVDPPEPSAGAVPEPKEGADPLCIPEKRICEKR